MKNKLISGLSLLLMSLQCGIMSAQTDAGTGAGVGSDASIVYPTGMTTSAMDSLLSDWKTKNFVFIEGEGCSDDMPNPVFDDSTYISRLSKLPTVIELPYNAVVRQYIDAYTTRLRKMVTSVLGVSNFYMPIIEEALDASGLPLELKYLPIIESAMNPSAVSRAGASGLWQFMLTTGKVYGLTSNSLIDERRDPVKSTWAAVAYLKDLYEIYHDWPLVIAAYNCGPGTVNKAIKRNGGKTDYWEIYYSLPKETRGYVPSFIAANYVMNYYCEHGICPAVADLALDTDTVLISRNLHFRQISDICQVPVEEIRSLNPQYKKDIIPGESMPCTLRLPQEVLYNFIANEDTVYKYKADEFFSKRKTVQIKEEAKSSSSSPRYHRIRSGETLSTIARRYGTTVKRLKQLNGLKNDRISAGKSLRVR